MSKRLSLVLQAAVLVGSASFSLSYYGLAWAQPVVAARPTVAAARIDTSEAPVIDADLSDPAWAKATVLDEFLQKLPDTGAPATQRTVLRIMYDENNLYFG